MAVDPLGEKYPGLSPFNYCLNNPLRFIDPNGMLPFKYLNNSAKERVMGMRLSKTASAQIDKLEQSKNIKVIWKVEKITEKNPNVERGGFTGAEKNMTTGLITVKIVLDPDHDSEAHELSHAYDEYKFGFEAVYDETHLLLNVVSPWKEKSYEKQAIKNKEIIQDEIKKEKEKRSQEERAKDSKDREDMEFERHINE